MFAYRPYTKDQQVSRKRVKKTAKQRGDISPSVDREVKERANDCCEWCGAHKSQVWGLQRAHLVRRWKLDETTACDIALLCGPSVNTGTCHWKVDYTKTGREWAARFRERLMINEQER
ncbi:hypothetical protein [Paenibacillus chitinolyticus]